VGAGYVEKKDGSDPFDGEPGPRLRGATPSAKKGLLAHVLSALLKSQQLTLEELIEHSSPDGAHFIDRKFLRKILRAESFPDYDTFVNMLDGLLELQALSLLFSSVSSTSTPRSALPGTAHTARQADEFRKPAATVTPRRSGQSGQRGHRHSGPSTNPRSRKANAMTLLGRESRTDGRR